jgi:ankyrin repeat protein
VLHALQLYTPLHAAAASGSVTVAQILVESGAEVDARNSYGNTPLHVACLNGHSNLCSELTYCGADINALNYRGQVSDKSLYYTRLVFTIATSQFEPSPLQPACFFLGGEGQRHLENQVSRQISWLPEEDRSVFSVSLL